MSNMRNEEHTFGHLKTRWRVLAKMCDIDHDFMPTVVAACCILHNLCEEKNSSYHLQHYIQFLNRDTPGMKLMLQLLKSGRLW